MTPVADEDTSFLQQVAWHEAGHAVGAVVRGFQLRHVSIDAEWNGCTDSTACDVKPHDPDDDAKCAAAIVALAGRAARRLCWSNDAWWHELERQDRLEAARLVGDRRSVEASQQADKLVAEHRAQVKRLAERLLRDEPPVHLSGADATAIITAQEGCLNLARLKWRRGRPTRG